jgi:hypothetical protein
VRRFKENNQKNYTGLDYSKSMIIAEERNQGLSFYPWRHAEFSSRTKVDSIIITGRSTSYLISNEDVNETLLSLHNNITNDGVIILIS